MKTRPPLRCRSAPPGWWLSVLAALAAGACSGADQGPPPETLADPEPTSVAFRAVDAATGNTLDDGELTVRYLVRTPIALDASAVDRIEATEPYRISHEVGTDSLVLEVRLEAPSYERLDTVLAVPRGASVGTLSIPLQPRPRRTARRPAARPSGGRTGASQPEAPAQGGGGAPAGAAPATGTGIDRMAILAGDRAFRNRDWRGAADAYRNMGAPASADAPGARDYQLALVRQGISHINLGEWALAREALRKAASFDFREYTAFFYLGQVECVLGDFTEGRTALNRIKEQLAFSISEEQRPTVLALVDYQLGLCSYNEFQRAPSQQTGRRAVQDLQAFVTTAQAFSPVPAQLQAALQDAQTRLREVQGRIR